MQVDTQTDGQTCRQTDRQTDSQADCALSSPFLSRSRSPSGSSVSISRSLSPRLQQQQLSFNQSNYPEWTPDHLPVCQPPGPAQRLWSQHPPPWQRALKRHFIMWLTAERRGNRCYSQIRAGFINLVYSFICFNYLDTHIEHMMTFKQYCNLTLTNIKLYFTVCLLLIMFLFVAILGS